MLLDRYLKLAFATKMNHAETETKIFINFFRSDGDDEYLSQVRYGYSICSLQSCILPRLSHSIRFNGMKLLLENKKFNVHLLKTDNELRFLNKFQKPDTLFI